MTPSVRIASLTYPDPVADRLAATHPWQRLAEIRQAVRRHLPGAAASVLARPAMAADGSGAVDWYSDLAGQPVPLLDLPPAQQVAARQRLADQLRAISRLAQGLERRDPDNRDLAHLLAQAIRYPGEQSVYVIAGAPVLISWGGSQAGQARTDAPPAAATRPAPRPRWWLPALGAVALIGLLFGGWLWLQHHTRQELDAALDAALANRCEPTAPLIELSAWLDRLDPDADRYPDIRMGVLTEAGICAEAAGLAERLAAAGQCEALPALAGELSLYDLGRQPFKRLKAALDRRLVACRRVQGLEARLTAAAGDCAAVAALDLEVRALNADAYPLDGLRMDIDQALAACRLAGDLGPRVSAAAGDCARLRDLAREAAGKLADHDSARAPLQGIKAALDAELVRCDLADHLEGELARSQGDCLAVAGLKETLSRHDQDREPLAAVHRRLEVALDQCARLDDLERRFAEAQGDCARIKALAAGIGEYRTNLRFLDIRTRLRRELDVCDQASALKDRIAAAGGDCAKARELAAGVVDKGDPRFAEAHAALRDRLADCDRSAHYSRRLVEAGADCTRLKALERDLQGEPAKSLQRTRVQVDKALKPCRPKPQPPLVAAARPRPPAAGSQPPAPPPAAAKVPTGQGSFAMRGECTGRLVIEPSAGWDGDGVRHIVTIDPPASARVARVASTNPGCRNCRLGKVGANVWRGDLWYRCGGRGIVPVSYAAYDDQGRIVCSGNGSDLCLGRR